MVVGRLPSQVLSSTLGYICFVMLSQPTERSFRTKGSKNHWNSCWKLFCWIRYTVPFNSFLLHLGELLYHFNEYLIFLKEKDPNHQKKYLKFICTMNTLPKSFHLVHTKPPTRIEETYWPHVLKHTRPLSCRYLQCLAFDKPGPWKLKHCISKLILFSVYYCSHCLSSDGCETCSVSCDHHSKAVLSLSTPQPKHTL